MTKKDYETIANVLRAVLESCSADYGCRAAGAVEAIADVAYHLAHVMAAYNPRFDHKRFYAACGLTANGRPIYK